MVHIITLDWFEDEGTSIPETDKNELMENALDQVHAKILEGYTAGELVCETEKSPYWGSWDLKEVEDVDDRR